MSLVLSSVKFQKTKAKEFAFDNLASPPSSPVAGQHYFDTSGNVMKYWDGSQWVTGSIADGSITTAKIADSAITTEKIANDAVDNDKIADDAVGTNQIADDAITNDHIADGAIAFEKLASPTNNFSFGSYRLTGLANAVDDADAVTKSQLNSAIANGLNGTQWKSPVRVVAESNLDLSSTETIDGVSVVEGDRVLVAGQTTASENGIYVVNASGAWSRATDLANGSGAVNAAMYVAEGDDNADSCWRCTSNADVDTVGTDALSVQRFATGVAYTADETTLTLSGSEFAVLDGGIDTLQLADDAVTADKIADSAITTDKIASTSVTAGKMAFVALTQVAFTKGDSSQTSIACEHNLGTRDVQVQVYQADSPHEDVICTIYRTDTNTVTLEFDSAPATNSLRVVVQGPANTI